MSPRTVFATTGNTSSIALSLNTRSLSTVNQSGLSSLEAVGLVFVVLVGIPLGMALLIWVGLGIWQSATDLFVHSQVSAERTRRWQRWIRVGWLISMVALVGILTAPNPVSRRYVSIPTDYRTGAICNDGTKTTAIGEGACSWHNGVDRWSYERVQALDEIDQRKKRQRDTRFLFGYIVLPFVVTMALLGIAVFRRDETRPSAPRQSAGDLNASDAIARSKSGNLKHALMRRLRQYPLASFAYSVTPAVSLSWLSFIESDRPLLNTLLGIVSGCIVGIVLLVEEGPLTVSGFFNRWLLQIVFSLVGALFALIATWLLVVTATLAVAQSVWSTVMGTKPT